MTLLYTTCTLSFEVKAVDDEQGLIEAYGSVFNNEDSGGDRVIPGAFKRSIKNRADSIKAGKSTYLWPMLWQHDPNQPIGGWYEAEEDDHGLKVKGRIILATKLGQDVYQLIKAGVIREFSIGYEVEKDGSSYDPKSGVRDLKALRLWEISPVTFAMNEEARLVGVKNATDLELKAVCGNTSGPIGSRDEAWDGSKAKKQIFAAAEKADGSLNAALCKRYFMSVNGDPQKKGSYSYPFWYASDSPHICVGAVKAVVAAIGGARGASAPSGLKGKCETLYNRINKAYPDDPQLIPPWKDDGKGQNHMPERKDFNDEYRQRQISDWRSGWYSLTSALNSEIMNAFDVGDMPMDDTMAALNGGDNSPGFIDALKAWVQQGIDLDFSNYLDDLEQNNSPSYYGYMSNDNPREHKAGATYSAATRDMLGQHTSQLHTMGDQLHQMATDLAATTGATTFDDSSGNPASGPSGDAAPPAKSASPPTQQQAPGTPHTDHSSPVDTDLEELDESEVDMALARLKLGSFTRLH